MLHKASDKHFAVTTGASLLFGTVFWIALLIWGAAKMNNTGAAEFQIQAGPILLHTLTKEVVGGGFRIGISFESGMLLYIGFWLLAALIAGLLLRYANNKHKIT
jgi:hypothetical protein